MKRKFISTVVSILVAIVIALLILALLLNYNIPLKQHILLPQERRYMRADGWLLTELSNLRDEVVVEFTSNENLTGSNIYAIININIENKKYTCSPALLPTGTTPQGVHLSVDVEKQELTHNYLEVEFEVEIYNDEKLLKTSPLRSFRTEDIASMLYLEQSTWKIYFHYKLRVYDYSVKFYFIYGTVGLTIYHSYIDGIIFSVAEPKVDFTYTPSTIFEGDEVLFDASISEGIEQIIKYEWIISENFTTIIYQINTTVPQMSYTFEKSGLFSVRLIVTDKFNQTSSAVKYIQVQEALSVDFSYSGQLYTYEIITFQAIVASKYGVQKYIWDFGDGNTIETTSESVNHYYVNPGKFKVTLTVVDMKNNIDTASKMLNITKNIYTISVSTDEVLINTETEIEITITKHDQPYSYANIKLSTKEFTLTTQTDNFGHAVFTVTFTERGTHVIEVIDCDYNTIIGGFSINCISIEPLIQTEYDKQQFYNIAGENDFSMTIILLDPETLEPILNYEPSVTLTAENVVIPHQIYIEENRFTITAKVFEVFNDTKERLINVFVEIKSNTYYYTTFNETVEMIPPIVDYWLCDTEGEPLPTNLIKGTEGFVIKIVKPEYLNITKENIYIEICSPTGKITSDDLTMTFITENYIYVDYQFETEGAYEVTVSIVDLPIFVPTRKYIFIVQELTTFDYISQNLQYIFIIVVFLMVIYLLIKKRGKTE